MRIRLFSMILIVSLLCGILPLSGSAYTVSDGPSVSYEAAKESMVLLKNENSVLPLKKQDEITVLGALNRSPVLGGGGSSHSKTDFKIRAVSDILFEDFDIKTDAVNVIYGDALNFMDEERKALIDDITDKMKDLDWDRTITVIQRLEKLMEEPEFAFSKQKIITECEKLVAIIRNPEVTGILKEMNSSFKVMKGKTAYMATVDLQTYIDEMNDKLDELKKLGLSDMVANPMMQRLAKLRKTIKNRGENYLDEETGLDKVVMALERHYETVRNSLIEAITALQNQDNTLALEFLEAADDRLKSIPLSKKKLELTRHFLTIAEKVVID